MAMKQGVISIVALIAPPRRDTQRCEIESEEMLMEETTIYFILNGEAAADEELRLLVKRLRKVGYEVEVRATWESGHGVLYAREATRAGADAVVACGGDGTLHEVLNGLMAFDERPMMSGLPYGTGNDFLSGIGVESGFAPLEFERWLELSPRSLDVGTVDGRYFLNMATAGSGAEISADASTEFKDIAGGLAYFVRAIPAAFDRPTRSAAITTADFEWEGELAFLFVGNGSQSGGGWSFCPAARLDDGLLDVVVVPERPLREMVRHAREMVQAESPGDYGPIIYRQVERLSVEFDEETPMNLDGEPCPGQSFEFKIIPGAIRFLMPH